MAYVAHGSQNRFSLGVASRRALAASALLAGTALCLITLFEIGHPLLALWVVLAVLGWLFIAGAAALGEGSRR